MGLNSNSFLGRWFFNDAAPTAGSMINNVPAMMALASGNPMGMGMIQGPGGGAGGGGGKGLPPPNTMSSLPPPSGGGGGGGVGMGSSPLPALTSGSPSPPPQPESGLESRPESAASIPGRRPMPSGEADGGDIPTPGPGDIPQGSDMRPMMTIPHAFRGAFQIQGQYPFANADDMHYPPVVHQQQSIGGEMFNIYTGMGDYGTPPRSSTAELEERLNRVRYGTPPPASQPASQPASTPATQLSSPGGSSPPLGPTSRPNVNDVPVFSQLGIAAGISGASPPRTNDSAANAVGPTRIGSQGMQEPQPVTTARRDEEIFSHISPLQPNLSYQDSIASARAEKPVTAPKAKQPFNLNTNVRSNRVVKTFNTGTQGLKIVDQPASAAPARLKRGGK